MSNVASVRVRSYSAAERLLDTIVNVGGTLCGLVGAAWLLVNVSPSANAFSVYVYCVGLLAMLSASAVYHLTAPGAAKELFCRFDYAAIFLMIAGTYTPFAVNRFDAATAHVAVPLIWLGAAAGIVLKLCFPRRFERVGVALYLAFGWASLLLFEPLVRTIGTASVILLVTGGVTYSIGAAFHLLNRVPFHHAIWHSCVLAAAAQHFAAIAVEFTR